MDSRTDCTGASTRAERSVEKIRYTETDPAADAGDGDGGGDLDALLGEVEVAIRASKGQKTGGKRRPRSLREVRAILQGIRDGTLRVEPVRADEPGSRRRGRWADESKVKNRPAWAKARIQSAMGRHFKITGLGTPARLVWWHLWSRGSGVLTDSTGRSVVEVGMVHAKWLAEETGLGERTVRRALVELEEAGMIARRRTFRGFKYRVLVPAALLAEIAGMSGQSGPSGQDMSLASGQDMSLASGQRVSLGTSDLLSDPPFRGGDEREDLSADQRATLEGVAAGREESEGGGRAVVADPVAVLRAMLVGAGVFGRVAEKLVAAPAIAAMTPADLAAEIEAAVATCGGPAPGVLVTNLRRIAAKAALRPKDSRQVGTNVQTCSPSSPASRSAPPEEPPATREQRAAIRAQFEATMKKPATTGSMRCPSDVKPKTIELRVDPLVESREIEAEKVAGTYSVFSLRRQVKVEIEPGADLAELVRVAADQSPDLAHVVKLITKTRDAARMDKHERSVTLAVLETLKAEVLRRRKETPPTSNPVEVLRALQAKGDPPIARIADGEVVEAGENVITTTPKRKRSRTA